MSWWQNLVIGGAAVAIQVLAGTIRNPKSKARYYQTAVSIWQAAKMLQGAMLQENPQDPNFQ